MKKGKIDPPEVEALTVTILQYLANNMELMGRFLALSGAAPSDLRELIGETEFQIGLFDFLLNHEPTLLAFCSNHSIDPSFVQAAKQHLLGTQSQQTY